MAVRLGTLKEEWKGSRPFLFIKCGLIKGVMRAAGLRLTADEISEIGAAAGQRAA